MTIRSATPDAADLDAIVHHRRAMFRDMGYSDEHALDAMRADFRPWLQRKMQAGEYLAWFALAPGAAVAAGVGLWLMDWPPHMVASGRWRGNILNVYCEPAHRRRGMARALMEVALAWCAANQVGAVILHASPHGRALYESLGFTATNEMRLIRPLA
ncbi:MAG TPA: GNAT family N-acetyltransferase [Bryobacteraceae bacterium]|nr:GNAT family N-acetyltransferase [Bryobacteraceae bacterium]